MAIRIGTSGFVFPDWKGPFYPETISNSKMLKYYSAFFDVTEINATYYRIPPPSSLERMSAAVPDGFGFTVKLHSSMTHARNPQPRDFEAFRACLAPLAESGKLYGLLAQFPWSFSNTAENRNYLVWLRGQLAGFPLHVEFRHISWMHDEAFGMLERNGMGFCSVDEPRLEGLIPPVMKTTGDTTYLRLHGRNEIDWWKPRPGHDRYDYDYSAAELEEWVGPIREAAKKSAKILIFFNNCHLGHAPRNALKMMEMLGITAIKGNSGENELLLEP